MGLILAIDQATGVTGYVVLDRENWDLVAYGCLDKSKIGDKTDFGHTIKRVSLQASIINLILDYQVEQVVCEGVQYQNNAETHKKLSKVQGMIEEICFILDVPCFTYNVNSWRSVLPVKIPRKREEAKKATKDFVLSKFSQLSDGLEQDVYDAIAIGLAFLIADNNNII